jgi:DNA polymerase-3 subunit delta'
MDRSSALAAAWAAIPGQSDATAFLERAAERPVHAYLFVGSSGVDAVARAFAAALLAADGSAVDRVLRSRHPDVVEIEPEGVTYRIKEDVRDRIIAEATRAPIESDRKVIIVAAAERLRADAANALLKTLEEPPARSVIILCTGVPEELLATVRSRCQRVDLAPLTEPLIAERLVADGIAPAQAELAARLAGGQLERARHLAQRWAPLRAAFVTAAARLDGSTAAAVRAAGDMQEALRSATEALETEHAQSVEDLEAELERSGYPDRTASGMRTRLKKRNERELRRAKTDALLEGITALETVYRDALAAGGPVRNLDRDVVAVDPRAAAAALTACADARHGVKRNPNEALLLERLFVHLPAAR